MHCAMLRRCRRRSLVRAWAAPQHHKPLRHLRCRTSQTVFWDMKDSKMCWNLQVCRSRSNLDTDAATFDVLSPIQSALCAHEVAYIECTRRAHPSLIRLRSMKPIVQTATCKRGNILRRRRTRRSSHRQNYHQKQSKASKAARLPNYKQTGDTCVQFRKDRTKTQKGKHPPLRLPPSSAFSALHPPRKSRST